MLSPSGDGAICPARAAFGDPGRRSDRPRRPEAARSARRPAAGAEPGRLAGSADRRALGRGAAGHGSEHRSRFTSRNSGSCSRRGRWRPRRPGYRLSVDPRSIDVFEFARLAEEGQYGAHRRRRGPSGRDPEDGARPLARARPRRPGVGAVRTDGGRPARRAPGLGARGPDRGRARARPPRPARRASSRP